MFRLRDIEVVILKRYKCRDVSKLTFDENIQDCYVNYQSTCPEVMFPCLNTDNKCSIYLHQLHIQFPRSLV